MATSITDKKKIQTAVIVLLSSVALVRTTLWQLCNTMCTLYAIDLYLSLSLSHTHAHAHEIEQAEYQLKHDAVCCFSSY